MNIIVIGAGAWGTALAVQAASRHAVTLWTRSWSHRAELQTARENQKYLPGTALPTTLALSAVAAHHLQHAQGIEEIDLDLRQHHVDLRHCDLVVIATPVSGVSEWLRALDRTGWLRQKTPVIWLSKGLVMESDPASPRLLHEVAAQAAPKLCVGALSGPSFAQEVALQRPCALVAASAHAHVREAMVNAFHSARLRVYANSDLTGVELGGAVKNVLAIAAGVSDGLDLGLNARAALLTRGLAEMTRLGLAMGAKAETFMGLSGMGDLLLTATGDLSRNRRVGLGLARGEPLAQALASLGHVAEGVLAAPAVVARAASLGVPMPVSEAVNDLLQGQLAPLAAMQRLMEREPSAEH